MQENIRSQAVNGVVWSGVERFATQGVQFVIEIFMARILVPADYGIIGMLAIFMAIARTLIDSGFSNALIQKRNRTLEDYSTIFYFNMVISLLIYAILYISAPWIATFYEQPELCAVTRVFSISLIISALSAVSRTILIINIDFKKQARVSLLAALISGSLGLWFAYSGYGVWALVWQAIANSTIQTILLFIMVKWWPSLTFSVASFKSMFAFGSNLLISSLLSTLYNNLYTLVIGKRFAAVDLGYYTKSEQFVKFPTSNLTGVITRVSYPTLVKLRDDEARMSVAYSKFLAVTSFIIFPMMIGLIAIAKPLIVVLITEEWLGMVLVFQILCIDWMWDPMSQINLNLLLVKGKSNLILRIEIIKRLLSIAILFGTLPFGLTAVCIGRAVYSFLAIYINSYYAGKYYPSLTFWKQMKIILPYLVVSLIMGISAYFVQMFVSAMWLKLLVAITCGAVVYITLSHILHLNALTEFVRIVKGYIKHEK